MQKPRYAETRDHTADVDDPASLARAPKARKSATGGEEGAPGVDGEDLVPLLDGDVVDRAERVDAGVVEDHVEAAITNERLDHRVEALNRRFTGDVRLCDLGASPEGDDLVCDRDGGLFVRVVVNDHVGALSREREARLAPDTARPARYEGRSVR